MSLEKIQEKITLKNILSAPLWIALIVVSLIHLIYLNNIVLIESNTIIKVTKCLLLPILSSIFIVRRYDSWKKQYWLIIGALFFAFLGDLLLIEWMDSDWLFLSGLGSFLIGHIFTITFIFKHSSIKKNKYWWFILMPFILMPLVIWQITTLKDSLVIPISIFFYAIMLCILLGISLTLIPIKNWNIYLPAVIGSILFISSDMILGLKMFKHLYFPAITVMATYISAQILLCTFYLNITNPSIQKMNM